MSTHQPHSITVTIPLQLDRRVTPNGRAHWGTKKRLTDEMRQTTTLSMLAVVTQAQRGQVRRLPLTLDYEIRHGKGRRRMDVDNIIASLKPVQDAISSVLGVDDKHFTLGTMTQTRDPTGRGEIVVTITEAGDEA